LDKFIKGGKLEGYAAFQIKVKNNELYALSSKVIVNHFLIPNPILREWETKFNPFDGIPVLKPFHYSINNVVVQNKYIYPVVALNLALRFIKPLAIKGRLLNQCHLLD
jgi:hypothetical protein